MNAADDLTRWNRAGLRRFRYVHGNAAEYLELIRAELARRFPKWTSIAGGGPDADEVVARKRVLDQYFGERQDYAWEIARSFARASHVLAGHIDAFANEGYIETATQWDLLRKLVEMLGYHPAPPSSASTVLVLIGKPGAAGTLPAGFQVKYAPASGGSPVIFETLDDVILDTQLNELRPMRWNRSERSFDPFEKTERAPWCRTPEMELSVGQPAVLLQQPARIPAPGAPTASAAVRAVEICAVDKVSNAVAIASNGTDTVTWLRGFTRLLAGPKKAYRPFLNGAGVVKLDRPHGLGPGEVIAWWAKSNWQFNVVKAVDGDLLRLEDPKTLPAGNVYRAVTIAPVMNTEGEKPVTEFRTPLTLLAAAYRKADGSIATATAFEVIKIDGTPAYYRLKETIHAGVICVVLAGGPSIGQVIAITDSPGTYRFPGSPAGLASGDWVVADFSDEAGILQRRPARIESIEAQEDQFRCVLSLRDAPTSVPPDVLRRLIRRVRRIETILDQPTFNEMRLADLVGPTVSARPVSIIQGIGALGTPPQSYADRLANAGVLNVGALAWLSNTVEVEGVSATRLREFRTHAEELVSFAVEARPPDHLLGMSLPAILAMEGGGTSGTQPNPTMSSLDRLHGPFRYTLYPLGYDRNPVPLPDRAKLTFASTSGSVPAALKAGRLVVVEQEGGDVSAVHQTKLVMVEATDPTSVRIELAEPLPEYGGFTLGNTIVRGNAVRAGHGEAKPERLLGSGNAALLNQEFILDVTGVAFVADPTMPSGVRADIQVLVDLQTWQPVASLRASGPTDPHYTVRMTEEGYLRIGFGDGQHGRRLPTGANNVRVRYRIGSGLAGNLSPGSLQKPVRPSGLIAAVMQPVSALGGNDMETVASMRESAPASLLTLERAVSLSDYASLAMSQSSIWQAAAFRHGAAFTSFERIEVVIVPASGAPLDNNYKPQVRPEFLAQQRDFLQHQAPAGIQVTVTAFEAVLVNLTVTVSVKFEEYDPAGVVQRVRDAVINAFSLRQRRLGQVLQRSELFKVVENVTGVENSDCEITLVPLPAMARPRRIVTQSLEGRETARSVVPRDRQVVYFDPDRSTLQVSARRYEL